jgi:hypothetical protein
MADIYGKPIKRAVRYCDLRSGICGHQDGFGASVSEQSGIAEQ